MVIKGTGCSRASRSKSEPAIIPKHVRFVNHRIQKNQQQPDATIIEKQAFAQACRQGDLDGVRKFIKNHRASINFHLEDNAPGLLIAAQNGHVAVVVHLCCQGADPCYAKPMSEGGNSILQCLLDTDKILADDQVECAKFILENVVRESRRVTVFGQDDKSKGLDHLNSDGETALVLAVRNQHVEMVKWLLNYGADINIITKSGQKIIQLVEKSKNEAIVGMFAEKLRKLVCSEGCKTTMSVIPKAKMHPEDLLSNEATTEGQNNKHKFFNIGKNDQDVTPTQKKANDDPCLQPQPIPCKRALSDGDFMKLRSKSKNKALLLLKLEGLEQYVDTFFNAGISYGQFMQVSERKLDEIGINDADDRKKILDVVHKARLVDSQGLSQSLKFKKPKWRVVSSCDAGEEASDSNKPTSGNKGYLILPALIGLIIFGFGWFLIKK